MKQKPIVLNRDRDVTLTPYLTSTDKTTAILIGPGGGYQNCDESEGKPVAEAFNALGYHAFILRYSVGKHHTWPNPLEDFDGAMDYLTNHAAEYKIDPAHILAAGFSAGGHVVTAAASAAKHKPFAVIVCYGLVSRETLAYCAPDAPDSSELVNLDTCPMFLASSRTDWIVSIENTTKLMDALQKNYIDYEAHIYGYALHGFSVGAGSGAVGPLFCSRVGNWVKDSMEWADELISGRYRSVRECAAYNDAYGSVLSTRNSCKLINSIPGALKVLKFKFHVQYLLYQGAQKKIGTFMDTVTLRNLFDLCKISEKTIAKMDEALSVFTIERCEKYFSPSQPPS